MGNNQSKMDALNSQMNLLVETQAEEIKELTKEVEKWKSIVCGTAKCGTLDATTEAPYGFHPSGSPRSKPLAEFQSDIITKLKEENEELKEMTKYEHFTCSSCKAHYTGCSRPICSECMKEDLVYNQLLDENAKLKEENEKQEDILVSIQDELLGEVFEPSFHKLLPKIKSLKEDYDKNWAAAEALSFMDYKYEDGEWKPYEEDCGPELSPLTGMPC
jgi:hypothetical protein